MSSDSTPSSNAPEPRVQPAPPKLGAHGRIPESWKEVQSYDDAQWTETLYQTSDKQFVLVHSIPATDSVRHVAALSRSEAAQWYARWIVPAELQGAFWIKA